ncbi:heterokaryon incompatibility protein domain-containing protein [Trichoderma longibrachiatum]
MSTRLADIPPPAAGQHPPPEGVARRRRRPNRPPAELIPLEEASPYDVLSYAWGDAAQDDGEVILINYVGVRVTRSLFNALRWIRHVSETRTVWIDALCVDVTDMTDRSQHVGLIRKIYTSAEKVIMWTGERGDVGTGMLFQVPMGRHEAEKHKKLLERPLDKFPVLMCSEASEFVRRSLVGVRDRVLGLECRPRVDLLKRLEALGVSDAISEVA